MKGKNAMKQILVGIIVIALAAAVWFFFNGGVSHWRLEHRIAQESAIINGRVNVVDGKVDLVHSRMDTIEGKLDRIEDKLDRILQAAERPLQDGMKWAE